MCVCVSVAFEGINPLEKSPSKTASPPPPPTARQVPGRAAAPPVAAVAELQRGAGGLRPARRVAAGEVGGKTERGGGSLENCGFSVGFPWGLFGFPAVSFPSGLLSFGVPLGFLWVSFGFPLQFYQGLFYQGSIGKAEGVLIPPKKIWVSFGVSFGFPAVSFPLGFR